jgi:acyl-CoA thioesterase
MSNNDDALELARANARRMYDSDAASRALGIEVDIPACHEAVATITVRDNMLNGHQVCHGGLLFTLADTAFAFACNSDGTARLSAAGSIDFLRPARAGDRLSAHATPRHRGRRRGVYDVEVRDQDERVIALFRGDCHAAPT